MATGYMINLTKAEAIHLLLLWNEFQAYKADHEYPPPGATGLSRALNGQLEALMDNLARWVVMINQEGRPDGLGQVTAGKLQEELAASQARMEQA